MSKATDTEELALTFVLDDGAGREAGFYRTLGYTVEGRAARETPEAKQKREEKLAQREAERRERSEEIFNRKRWTRDQAVAWVAFRDKHSMQGSIRRAVFYDPASLRDPDPNSSFAEALRDGRITEYRDGGAVWYLSEQVRDEFPEPITIRGNLSDAELDRVMRDVAAKLGRVPSQNKCAKIVRDTYPQVTSQRIRDLFPSVFPGMKQGRGSRKWPET